MNLYAVIEACTIVILHVYMLLTHTLPGRWLGHSGVTPMTTVLTTSDPKVKPCSSSSSSRLEGNVCSLIQQYYHGLLEFVFLL